MSLERIGSGFGILITDKEGRILLGKRNDDPSKARSSLHGEGTWTFPGGKQRPGETFKAAACRELEEEIGAKVEENRLHIICLNEDILPDVHFNTVGLVLEGYEDPIETKEPEQITEWCWYDPASLPENLFPASAKILECCRRGVFHLELN